MRLIDAGVLLENMNQLIKGYGVIFSPNSDILCGCIMALDRTKRIVEDAHTIDPESLRSQWIPVTERLPETSQDVLITRRSAWGTVRVMKAFYMQSDDGGIWASQCGIDTTGVIAWLPLPEPYKEENNA